jgi:hypothetical protein
MALEHCVDRLQVELRRHVADRAIFVVEVLGGVRAVAVAGDQVLEHLPMRVEVLSRFMVMNPASCRNPG